MSLETLNNSSPEKASQRFLQCCSSERWVKRMVAGLPYVDVDALRAAADNNWQGLAEADYLQAFEGHPKIGDVNSLKAKYASSRKLAAGEQSSIKTATDEVIQQLAAGNIDYKCKFGFIFIVCASGKSAQEMADLLQSRLLHDRVTELKIAAREQQKILKIRLEKLL